MKSDGVVIKDSQIGVTGVHKYFREVPHTNHLEERGSAQAKDAFDEAFGNEPYDGLFPPYDYFILPD